MHVADEERPDDLSELITLQRQTMTALARVEDIARQERTVEIQRDGRGRISGAISRIAEPGEGADDDEDDSEIELS